MPTDTEHTRDGAAPRHGQRVLGNARSAARAVAMSGWTVAVTQSARVYMRLTRVPERQRVGVTQHFMEHWAGGLLNVFGIEPHWLGAATARPRKARLVVANHRSPVDILLMIHHFRGSVLGRHDLERWPLLGWAARAGGTIFVDRTDPRSGVKAIREIRRRLAAGQTVIVFPEGTTHRGDEVRPFLGGAFAAVRGLDVELVPVGVAYDPGSEFVDETFVEHMKRMAQRPRTRVALCAGEPCAAHTDRDVLAAEMQREVQRLVLRARAALSDAAHGVPRPR
jgi:1-acyl-sn-glycerol-3-phosphate acyltransferase